MFKLVFSGFPRNSLFLGFGWFCNIFHNRGTQIMTSVLYELEYDTSIDLLRERFCYSADKKKAFHQNDAFHAFQECLLA